MENFYVKKHGLKPADRIVTPKSNFQLVQHHAIYLGKNHLGTDLIIENVIGIGVRIVTADAYFRAQLSITRIDRFKGNGYEREQAVKRALANVGQPYSLIDFNCESFANLVQHGRKESAQSNTGLALAGIALLFGLIAVARK